MSTPKNRGIRALLNFGKAKDEAVLSRGQAVLAGMTDNPKYPKPPIDLPLLKMTLDGYSIAIVNAFDGGKKALVERNQLRETVIKMLRILAHYVEVACNDEMATFMTSGYEPLIVARGVPQPLTGAAIRKIDHGSTTGQLLVRVKSLPKAWSYELRYAALGPDGTVGSWIFQPVTAVSSPTACNGLVPGTTYTFQVRALGRLGFSNWSDAVVKICT